MSTSRANATHSSDRAMQLLITNLELMQYPNMEEVKASHLISIANHKLTDHIITHLLELIDKPRFHPTISLYNVSAIKRREFRTHLYTWLDSLKLMFPGPQIKVRKSYIDQGCGDEFIQLLLGLSFHALRVSLAQHGLQDHYHPNFIISTIQSCIPSEPNCLDEKLKSHLHSFAEFYNILASKEQLIRQCGTGLTQLFALNQHALDSQLNKVSNQLSPLSTNYPPTSVIQSKLADACNQLTDYWQSISPSSASYESPFDLVLDKTDPTTQLPLTICSKSDPPESCAPPRVNWSNTVSSVLPALSHCFRNPIHTPYPHLDNLTIEVNQSTIHANQAEERCHLLEREIIELQSKLDQLSKCAPNYDTSLSCHGDNISSSLTIRPFISSELKSRIASPSWYLPDDSLSSNSDKIS